MYTSTEKSLGKLRIGARHLRMEQSYWLNRFTGFGEKQSFPYDVNGLDSVYRSKTFLLDAPTTELLYKTAKDSEYALLTLLMVAVNLLLYRYNGRTDICIGTMVSGEEDTDAGSSGVLAIRHTIDETLPVRQLILAYAAAFREDLKHRHYPFEILLEDLGVGPDQENPLFDVLVVLDGIGPAGLREGLIANNILRFLRTPEGLELQLTYNAAFYAEEAAKRTCEHLFTVLGQLLNEQDKHAPDVSLLSENEAIGILQESGATGVGEAPSGTIPMLFEEQVRRAPEKIVVYEGGESWTYALLNTAAEAWAETLRGLGAGPGVRVGITMEPSKDLLVAILGVLKTGAAYVPVDPTYPNQRKQFIYTNSGIELLITKGRLGSEESGKSTPLDETNLVYEYRQEAPPAERLWSYPVGSPENLAYVMYTSGTTGDPKGVMITHQNLVNYLWWAAQTYVQEEDAVFAFFTSISFDLTVTSVFLPLVTGNSIRIYNYSKGDIALKQILQENSVSIIKLTPSHLKIVRELEADGFFANPALRRIIVGGENFETSLAQDIFRKFGGAVELYNEYGPTETTVGCMIHRFDPGIDQGLSVPIGRPIDHMEIYLLDSKRRLVPRGITGEIYIGGAGVGKGYLFNPVLTAEKFVDHFLSPGKMLYRTGDLAKRLTDGDLVFLGRGDSQVKVNGYRIELEEIGSVLRQLDGIRDVVVIADKAGISGGDRLCAYYVAEEEIAPEVLTGHLSGSLPPFMIPACFVQLSVLPLTANGKLDVRSLPAPALRSMGKAAVPETEMQEFLQETLKEILKVDKIGGDDNIFKMGMDSIRTIRLGAMIHKKLHFKPEIADFYEYPIVRHLARRMEEEWQRACLEDPDKLSALENYKVTRELREFRAKYEPMIASMADPDNVEDIYPMSEIEKAMVYYSLLEQSEPLYLEQNIYHVFYVNFNLTAFKEALNAMCRKHSSLRTGYEADHSVHIVYKRYSPSVLYYDISHLASDMQESWIEKHRKESRKIRRNFLIPTLKCSVFRIQPDHHLFMLEFHHTVMDGWSLHAFLVELNDRYVSLVTGDTKPDIPLKCSFRDNVIREMADKRNNDFSTYWKNELEGYKRFVFPFHGVKTGKKDAILVQARRPPEYIEVLQDYCGVNRTTMRTLCFAAYVYTLYLVSFEEDIVVGQVTHTRPVCEDGEKLLGCFLNTVPVRVMIDPSLTVQAYIQYIEEKMRTLKKYENISLLEIKNKVGERSDLRNPFFDTKFNFIDFHVIKQLDRDSIDQRRGRQLRFNNFTLENTHCDFCIELTGGHVFTVSWVFSPDFIDAHAVERLLDYYMRVLDLFVTQPDLPLRKEHFLAGEERSTLLNTFNATVVSGPAGKGIMEVFEEQALVSPGSIAVQDQYRMLTYRELNEKANQFARVLIGRGIGRDTIVAIRMERCVEMMIALFGILKVRAAYLPLPVDYPAERVRDIIQDAGVRWIVTTSGMNATGIGDAIYVDDESAGIQPSSDPGLPFDPNDLVYVIYTSGSTGKPKGVMIEHHSLISRMHWMQKHYPLGPLDCILQKTTYSFDISVLELFGWVLGGARLYLLPPAKEKDPARILAAIQERGVTCMHFVPSMFTPFVNYLHDAAGAILPECVKYLFLCGEAVITAQVNRFNEMNNGRTKLVNLYGPTEASMMVSSFDCPEQPMTGPVPIGKPIDDSKIYILSRRLELQPVGVFGELYIAGSCLARGYLNHPELTRERFIDNPYEGGSRLYRSGDLARWQPDGNIEFAGRTDDQVKIRGFRIEPGEIETVLLENALVKQAVVLPREDGAGNKRLIGYIVPADGFEKTALLSFLKDRLPLYMIPDVLMTVDELPRLKNGKVDKKALPDAESTDLSVDPYIAPRNAIERMLAAIWEELLAIKPAGVRDNFFALGGNSLLALSMTNQINKQLGTALSFQVIFEVLTIEGMVEKILRMYSWLGHLEQHLINPEVRAVKIAHLCASGTRGALFFNAPIGGICPSTSVVGIADMTPHLEKDISFYSIQAPAIAPEMESLIKQDDCPDLVAHFNSLSFDLAHIDTIAEEAVAGIMAIQKHGPYSLGGYCTGCILTMEIAKKLIERGEKVRHLVLIDLPLWVQSSNIDTTFRGYGIEEIAWFIARDIGRSSPLIDIGQLIEDLRSSKEEERWAIGCEYIEKTGLLHTQIRPVDLRRAFENKFYNDLVINHFFAAVKYKYPDLTIEAPFLLFAQDLFQRLSEDFLLHLKNKTSGGKLTLQSVAGDHSSILLSDSIARWIPMIPEYLCATV